MIQMADAIYVPKSDILDLITEEHEAGGFTDYSNYSDLWDTVDDMPAADVQPVKRGKWENTNTPNQLRCSNCEIIHLIAQYPHGDIKYCPNCGARMGLGDEKT